MKTLILETEYSVLLKVSYFIDNSFLKDDWLCICLYYDQVISLIGANDKFNKDLIQFIEYPMRESMKQNYTGGQPLDAENITLNAVRYAVLNDFHFLLNLYNTDRDEFIMFVSNHIPSAIPTLKKSFLSFDLIRHFVVKNIPAIEGQLSPEIEKKLIEFKKSDFGQAFVEGITYTVEKYSAYYNVTPELDQQLKNEFIDIQQDFFGKLQFDKIKKFRFSSLVKDGIGKVTELIIPFIPIGTLIELFNFIKTQIEFNRNKELQFILSIFYLQKILNEDLNSTTNIDHCVICQTTAAEISRMNDKEVHEYVFKNTLNMCYKHSAGYLTARKSGQLTGKSLFLILKKID